MTYEWAAVEWMPLHILRVWARRRWPAMTATIGLDLSGSCLEISGDGLDVGRLEAMLDEVCEQGYPAPA